MKKNCFDKTCYYEFLVDKYNIANITTYPKLEGTVLISWNFIIFHKKNVLHVLNILLFLVTQSCPTLCNPKNCSLLGSSVHRILQARILEWVAMPCSRGSSQPRDWIQVSCIAGGFFYHLSYKGNIPYWNAYLITTISPFLATAAGTRLRRLKYQRHIFSF